MNQGFSDINSFETLFRTYFEPLVNFVNSRINHYENSEEIVQDTFMKLWDSRDTLVIRTSVKSYLYQATKNTMIDFIRKSKHINVDIDSINHIPIEGEVDLDPYIIRSELEKALLTLKEKNRIIFKLNKFEGLTYKEIAEHLNMSERGVEDNISRAVKSLKDILKDNKHIFK